MDSQTFNQLLDRLIMYIDTLDAEPTDAKLVVDSVTQSLMNVIPQPEQIDYPNISPEQPTQGSGHALKYFRGELKVPTIDREHDVEVPMNTSSPMPLSLFALPLLISASAAMVRPPVRLNRRDNKRVKNNRGRRKAARANRKASRARRKASRARRRQSLKDKKRKARTNKKQSLKNKRRNTRIEEKQTRKNAKKINRKTELAQKQAERKIRHDNSKPQQDPNKSSKPKPDDIPDKLKEQLVEKNPKRFKLDEYGNLLESNPDGTSKRPSEKTIIEALDDVVQPRFAKGLKVLVRALGAVGIAYTAYDAYRLYDIYSDDKLSDDDKITRSGPIIGTLLGSYGGAVIGAIAGTAATGGPWGTFFGALAGGIGGAIAGDKLGELVAEYIVGDTPPKHPSGKDWDDLTPMEIESWWTYQANKRQETYIDSTSTQQMEPQPLPSIDPPEPQFKLLPIPDETDDVDEPQTDSTDTQQLDDLVSTHVQLRKQHVLERQQLIEKIQQLA